MDNVEIEILDAPGHTSEMVAYRVGDDAVLTGDSLFLDSVGRTELEFGEEGAEKGTRMQYETLHDTLLELPEELTVLPGHVTVNEDGTYANASLDELVGATLKEVHSRLDLADVEEEAFVERMVENVPEKPDLREGHRYQSRRRGRRERCRGAEPRNRCEQLHGLIEYSRRLSSPPFKSSRPGRVRPSFA